MDTWNVNGKKVPLQYLTDDYLFDLYDRMKPVEGLSGAEAEMLGKPEPEDPRWNSIKEEAEKRGVLNRKVIMVDMDGVIADNVTPWLSLYNYDYDDNLTPQDITDYDISKFTKEQCGHNIFKYIEQPGFYDKVEQIENSFWGINYIRSMGMRVKFVTAGFRQGKMRWLFSNGYLKDKDDFLVIEDKHTVEGDCLIDDYYEKNIVDFVQTGRPAILYSQPWNMAFDYDLRANSWDEVIKRLETLYGTKQD